MLTWKRGQLIQLSKHFTSTEFTCQCGHCVDQMVDSLLIKRLETLREAIGGPIQILSGYRCPAHQAELLADPNYETVKLSQHELGRAADIRPYKLGIMPTFEAEAAKLFHAIGAADTWLHVDMRDDRQRRWTYK